MKKLMLTLAALFLVTMNCLWAANTADDHGHNKHENRTGTIAGVVTDENGERMPFAEVGIVGTTLGTATNANGEYSLKYINQGKATLEIQYLGYKPLRKTVEVKAGKTLSFDFQLQKDALGLDEVVVTGDRVAKNRKTVTTIVNTISPQIFKMTQSPTFGEGLNFTPGLRMEDNCQNCGASTVRMNGLEGSYSQILINSRPIFSGLAGVYGLELIPANMIDRVEVVRGGGSALYGSNAIAGTINVILKDPIANIYEAGFSSSFTGIGLKDRGAITPDHSAHINTSLISADNKTGLALYGFWRDRNAFDANNDGFSEIANLENTTIGTRIFHRLGNRNKITADFFNIKEDRRGGNKFDLVEHEADISESLRHNVLTGAISYDHFFREKDLWSVYVSGQKIDRKSYYGGGGSLKDYGKTDDFTYTLGTQYDAHFHNAGELTVGTEFVSSKLEDIKLGYKEANKAIADQDIKTLGVFAQYEIKLNKLTASVGARFEHYKITDGLDNGDEKKGDVFSPRITFKYDITDFLQARASYSQGYRAPQIFNEDLHIETSQAKKIIHTNADDLKQETSHSWMASLDFNKQIGTSFVNVLIEGFYTKLEDAFADSFAEDKNKPGVVVYERVNAKEGAEVKGINMEVNFIPSEKIAFQGGFTFQKSEYKEKQDFNNTNFMKTPDNYGYFSINYTPIHDFGVALTGTYTGKMSVVYDSGLTFKDKAEEAAWEAHKDKEGQSWVVRETESFFDMGVKMHYDLHVGTAKLRLFTGMKNIFNSYQEDFDKGGDRAAGYIYGPLQPRTIYFGITLGNNLR